jgi:hypothetical protein
MRNAHFALAKNSALHHIQNAFQASSPKLPGPAGNGRAIFFSALRMA